MVIPVDATTVKLININHIDPKGWIPSFLINWFKERSLKVYEQFQKVYGKD